MSSTDLFTERANPPFLARVEISELFGFKNYVLDFSNRTVGNIALLYGDNGSGKSTILNLIYSLLSRNRGEGNKGYVAKTPFRTLRAVLSDGTTINARKKEGLTGSYYVEATGVYKFDNMEVVVDSEMSVTEKTNKDFLQAFESYATGIGIDFVYITDVRDIKTTIPSLRKILRLEREDESERSEWSLLRSVHMFQSKTGSSKLQFDIVAITEALRDWIRSKTYQESKFGQYTGDNIYLELARQIASPQLFNIPKGISKSDLLAKVDLLENLYQRPTKYALMPTIRFDEFRSAIERCSVDQLDLLFAIIAPYLDTLVARNSAISPITEIVDTVLNELNSYFVDKQLQYSLEAGLTIQGWKDYTLNFESLSSGERQLVFLFCSSILAREGKCIFLIDEPELSLNVKWQRMLFGSLSRLVRGSDVNFIAATHSLEILTQHENSILTLGK